MFACKGNAENLNRLTVLFVDFSKTNSLSSPVALPCFTLVAALLKFSSATLNIIMFFKSVLDSSDQRTNHFCRTYISGKILP